MPEVNPIFTTTKSVSLSFPHLVKPNTLSNKYQTDLVFTPDHPDLPKLKQLAVAVAKEAFPGRDIVAEYKAGKFRLPWTEGDKKFASYAAARQKKSKEPVKGMDTLLKGSTVVTAKATLDNPPMLAYRDKGAVYEGLKDAALIAAQSKFYTGVKAHVELRLYIYNKGGNEGVGVGLNTLLSLNQGTRLSGGGGRSASEVFKDVIGQETDVDPTENTLDEDL
jgi:hypothetical protein